VTLVQLDSLVQPALLVSLAQLDEPVLLDKLDPLDLVDQLALLVVPVLLE
jgi:hypothetical protein